MKKIIAFILFSLFSFLIVLNVLGIGILVDEVLVKPNENFPNSVQKNYGLINKSTTDSLVCSYMLNFKTRHHVFWYSSTGFMGIANCPIYYEVLR